jgi:hypothetical protein
MGDIERVIAFAWCALAVALILVIIGFSRPLRVSRAHVVDCPNINYVACFRTGAEPYTRDERLRGALHAG